MNTRIKLKQKDKIQIQVEQQEECKTEFVKRIIPNENHTLFEINVVTNKVKEAEYNMYLNYKLDWNWKKGNAITSQKALVINDDCVYVCALNKKNTIKKYNTRSDGSKQSFLETLKL